MSNTILLSCELYTFIQLLINSINVLNCYFESDIFLDGGNTAKESKRHDPVSQSIHYNRRERKKRNTRGNNII